MAKDDREAKRRRRLQPHLTGRSLFADRRDQLLYQERAGAEFLYWRPRRLSSADGHGGEVELRRTGTDHEVFAAASSRFGPRGRKTRPRESRAEQTGWRGPGNIARVSRDDP